MVWLSGRLRLRRRVFVSLPLAGENREKREKQRTCRQDSKHARGYTCRAVVIAV